MSTTPHTEHHGAAGHTAGPHDHRDQPGGRALTRLAVSATLHCLTGCAIGEILGLVLATWWGWSNGPSIALAVVLAFLFGYAFTITPVLRSGLPLKNAVGVAVAADTVSILTMEVVDNAVVLAVPGAMEAGLTTWLFWASLAFSLAVAFVVTVPVNRALIARGKGHAVVHQYHQ
jgi:Domain of unknown function (DUF4396)